MSIKLPPMKTGDEIYVGTSEIEAYRAACDAAGLRMKWTTVAEGSFTGAWLDRVLDTRPPLSE